MPELTTQNSIGPFPSGQDFVVCGCGPSLSEFKNPEQFNTIGVNDVGRLFEPDFLVVINPETDFSKERWHYIQNTNPRFFLSQFPLKVKAKKFVKIKLTKFGELSFSDLNTLGYSLHSPFVALNIAFFLGATKIGVIGVDFTENHFFGETGVHKLTGNLGKINSDFENLNRKAKKLGVDIVNLSKISRVTAFRRGRVEEIGKKSEPLFLGKE